MWDLEDLEAYLAYLAMKSDFQDAAYEDAKNSSESGKKKGV